MSPDWFVDTPMVRSFLICYHVPMKITIIGGGNMGEAFARGLHEHFDTEFDTEPLELSVCERNVEKHPVFHSLEIVATASHVDAVRGADVVILAVKPADMAQTCRDISGVLTRETLVISIAAGVRLDSLTSWFGEISPRIVRVMPNLLASIGRSVCVWYCDIADTATKKLVQQILQSVGAAHELDTEEDIDKATAISGCGPAYVWYFMRTMMAAGRNIGLSSELSRALTLETFDGASVFAAHRSDFDPEVMGQRVASKGGATEQALEVFDKRGLAEVIIAAVDAAYKRSVELGNR
jgi:pyrroline-5-carboxylate reductase